MAEVDLSGTTPSQLIVWLAAQCHDGKRETITGGELGPMGETTLDEMCDLARDVAQRNGATPASVALGGMGKITLDELRALATETKTLGEILNG